jgi:hypothetical protein
MSTAPAPPRRAPARARSSDAITEQFASSHRFSYTERFAAAEAALDAGALRSRWSDDILLQPLCGGGLAHVPPAGAAAAAAAPGRRPVDTLAKLSIDNRTGCFPLLTHAGSDENEQEEEDSSSSSSSMTLPTLPFLPPEFAWGCGVRARLQGIVLYLLHHPQLYLPQLGVWLEAFALTTLAEVPLYLMLLRRAPPPWPPPWPWTTVSPGSAAAAAAAAAGRGRGLGLGGQSLSRDLVTAFGASLITVLRPRSRWWPAAIPRCLLFAGCRLAGWLPNGMESLEIRGARVLCAVLLIAVRPRAQHPPLTVLYWRWAPRLALEPRLAMLLALEAGVAIVEAAWLVGRPPRRCCVGGA